MIVLLETIHADAHELLATVDDVVVVDDPPRFDDHLHGPGVRAVVTRGRGRVTADLIERLPDLRVVARCGAGLDNVDVEAARVAGVAVAHAPGVTTDAVAEAAIMLMLAATRRLCALDRAVTAGQWEVRQGYTGVEVRGKRLGVVGLGAIGSRVAELGRALSMDVVGTSRSSPRSPSTRSAPVPWLPLDELLASSDVIQLCVPLAPDTHGLIGERELTLVRPGCVIVNTSRGAVVDHAALGRALDAGALGGYAADVWDPEPPAADDPLVADPRTIVTPHVAALTDVTYREICVRTAEAVVAVLTGTGADPRFLAVRPPGS